MIEIQEGILWKSTKHGSMVEAKDGYRFYIKSAPENYNENGDLVSEENRVWCTYMSCVWKTAEEVNANIVMGQKPFVYEETETVVNNK